MRCHCRSGPGLKKIIVHSACLVAAVALTAFAEPGTTVVSSRAITLAAETPLGRATITAPPGSELENSEIRSDKITVRQGAFSAVVPREDIAPAAQNAGAPANSTAPPAIPAGAPVQSPSPVLQQGREPLPEQRNMFAGVPFGAGIEEARQKWQLEKVEAAAAPDDPVTVYLREEESLVLGGAVVREVIYYFVNGKFYAVAFVSPDHRQSAILREALTLIHGTPAVHDGSDNSLTWPGRSVSAHMVINPSNGESRVLLFSSSLQADYERSLREAAAKTSADL